MASTRQNVLLTGLLLVLAVAAVQVIDDGEIDETGGAVTGDATGPDLPEQGLRAATSSTTTTEASTTTERPERRATLAFTGDLLPHSPVVRQAERYAEAGSAYDFTPMFDLVRERLSSADLAICHLETPLAADSNDISGYPVFNAPSELAAAIADAGYDACSTASNHSYDRGPTGVASTLEVLDRFGIGHSGTARTGVEAATPVVYEVDDIAIAHLSYTYGLNGFTLPGDQPWLVDVIDEAAIVGEAAAARAAGADFVVVSLHWGSEYRHAPTPEQVEMAARLMPSPDIDLIVGHHAHVVQPIDRVGGEWVVYGLGNFLSNQSGSCCVAASQDGMMVEVDIEEQPGGGFAVDELRYVPTWVDRSDYTIVAVDDALADPATPGDLRSTLESSRARTDEAVMLLGPEPIERG